MPPLPAELEPLVSDPRTSAVLVDFDGTLAAIVDRPEDSRPLPAATAALTRLVAKVGTVAVISGRPADFLIATLAVEGVLIFGQYGLERLVDGKIVVDARAQPAVAMVAEARRAAAAAWPDLVIEHKGDLALGVHWRTNPVAAPTPAELKIWGDQFGLESLPGRMTWEFRPEVPVDKGVITDELLNTRAVRVALVVGDDVGDIPMFIALDKWSSKDPNRIAIRVGVHSEEAPPELLERADLVVAGPVELAVTLTALADRCDQ